MNVNLIGIVMQAQSSVSNVYDSQQYCMDLVLMAIHGCMVLHSICQYCLILNATCESCKALKIDSFAKNHKNNDGHGGLLKDMIVNPEVVLQFAYI